MKRLGVLAFAIAATCLPACKRRQESTAEAARQVASSLVDDVSPVDSASAIALGTQQVPWPVGGCDAIAEPSPSASFSHLSFSGECAFEHNGPASCRARGDDYYAIIRRKLSDGTELELYLNVEYYTGPGSYDRKVELLALIRRGQSLYRWSNLEATVTLGFAGGMSTADKNAEQAEATTPTVVQLPSTVLTAEPGTATRRTITVSGTISCVLEKPPVGR